MKTCLSIVALLVLSSLSLAQQTVVAWSSMNNGFGSASGGATKVQSLFGLPAVGSNQQGGTIVGSGFLPNPIVFQSPSSCSSIKVLAEGPFNAATGEMGKTLNAAGILAAHFGSIQIPVNAVDSITLELRNAAVNPTTRILKPAWLLSDGSIRAFTDTTKQFVEFESPPGNYYVAIHHRNHLGVLTASPQALMGIAPPAFDFTLAMSQAYGTHPMKQMGTKFCMYAGDANQSGIITAADANTAFGAINTTGYSLTDINLSGITTAADANMIFGNLNVARQFSAPVTGAPADDKTLAKPRNNTQKSR